MHRLVPAAWYWTGPGRRVELSRPTASNSALWKPLYLEPPPNREAELEHALRGALAALEAAGRGPQERRQELAALTAQLRRVLDTPVAA